MSDRAFVDSNILVYAHDRSQGDKHRIARDLVARLWRDRNGVLSTQVVQELYVNLRSKVQRPLPADRLRELIEDYLRWDVVTNDGAAVLGALDIEARYQLSFWDALIVQAATAAGTARLYTEDLNDGQVFGNVEIVNPFRRS